MRHAMTYSRNAATQHQRKRKDLGLFSPTARNSAEKQTGKCTEVVSQSFLRKNGSRKARHEGITTHSFILMLIWFSISRDMETSVLGCLHLRFTQKAIHRFSVRSIYLSPCLIGCGQSQIKTGEEERRRKDEDGDKNKKSMDQLK